MTFEDALKLVTAALAPRSLSKLQTDVFRGAWNNHSYLKIALEVNHRDSYIKDIGSELWQLLSQALGIKVTKLNLREVLTHYIQMQQMHRPALPHQRVDWGEAPDVSQLCGRAAQLTKLEEWVMQDRCRMLAIVGMGGIGKTTIVTQLTQQLVDTEQFEVVVWRSLRQAPPLQELLIDLMSAIAPEQSLPLRLDAMMRLLLEQLRDRRCLLVLDNVEAVLQGSELVGTYRVGYENYGWLLQQLGAGRHQSSVLLTSREIPAQISIQAGPAAAVRLLRLEPLSIEEGKSILAAKGLEVQTEQIQQVQQLIERYQGNPLALEIVATPIKELFNSNIAAFLAQDTLLFKDIRDLLADQFARLTSLERQVMYWLAIERKPVTAAQLQADLVPSVTLVQLRYALQSLDGRSLIEKIQQNVAPVMNLDGVSYTQQAVVMEYVTSQLIEQVCHEEQVQTDCLKSHALVKAQAKDCVKDVQTQPKLTQLLEMTGSKKSLKNLLLELLKIQQAQVPLPRGYFGANAIHLLRQLGVDLSHLDFPNLTIWQADSQMVDLHRTNFSSSDSSYSNFTQTVSDISSVAFSPDGKRIATSHDNGEVCVWQLADGQQIATFSAIASWVKSLAFSPDGQALVSAALNQSIRLWDAHTGQYFKTWQGYSQAVFCVVFHPQKRILASCHGDKAVRLWDVQTGECLSCLPGHSDRIISVAFSPDGQILASGSFDRTIRLWDVKLKGHTRQAQAIAFDSTERRLASGSNDHTVKLWELQTGQCLQTLQGHKRAVVSISFHPQGNLIASGSFDRTLKLWDLQKGINIATLQGHTSPIRSATFALEGQMLVSSSKDGTIRLWNSPTDECMRVVTVDRPYEGMNISGVKGLTEAQTEALRVLGAIAC